MAPIKRGQFVRKKSWTLFNGTMAIQVRSVRYINDDVLINGKFRVKPNQLVVLDHNEAATVNAEFKAAMLIMPAEDVSERSMCQTVDRTSEDGRVKNKERYTTAREAQVLAYRYGKKNPDKNYEAYKCKYCGFYHFGNRWKTVKKETIIDRIRKFIRRCLS